MTAGDGRRGWWTKDCYTRDNGTDVTVGNGRRRDVTRAVRIHARVTSRARRQRVTAECGVGQECTTGLYRLCADPPLTRDTTPSPCGPLPAADRTRCTVILLYTIPLCRSPRTPRSRPTVKSPDDVSFGGQTWA